MLSDIEQVVVGTLLNEYGQDRFFARCCALVREDMFSDRRNAFTFSVIKRMVEDGIVQTTPIDVLEYAERNGIAYGNAQKFCIYMCEIADKYYAFSSLKDYVRRLIDFYVAEKRRV